MAKVYVLNNGGHDYSAAASFGEVIVCDNSPVRKDDVSQMFRQLTDNLQDFRACDYILVTSLTSLCMVAAGIIADRFGKINMLLFHNGQYVGKSLVFETSVNYQDGIND